VDDPDTVGGVEFLNIIFPSPLFWLNACSPIEVTLCGMVTDGSDEQRVNE
jgi:hypothetical protein